MRNNHLFNQDVICNYLHADTNSRTYSSWLGCAGDVYWSIVREENKGWRSYTSPLSPPTRAPLKLQLLNFSEEIRINETHCHHVKHSWFSYSSEKDIAVTRSQSNTLLSLYVERIWYCASFATKRGFVKIVVVFIFGIIFRGQKHN